MLAGKPSALSVKLFEVLPLMVRGKWGMPCAIAILAIKTPAQIIVSSVSVLIAREGIFVMEW